MTTYRKVKKVIDGDTFQTYRRINGSNFVRIAGLRAPERYQFGGVRATNRLKRQIQGKTVTLQPVGRSYGRTVARTRFRGRLIR